MAAPGAETAYAVAQVHSIGSTCTLDRSVMNGEGDGIALRQRHHLGAGLHARTLLGQNKLTSSKVLAVVRRVKLRLEWEKPDRHRDLDAGNCNRRARTAITTGWDGVGRDRDSVSETRHAQRDIAFAPHPLIPLVGDGESREYSVVRNSSMSSGNGYLKYRYSPLPNPWRAMII